jgi:hypothetical protein
MRGSPLSAVCTGSRITLTSRVTHSVVSQCGRVGDGLMGGGFECGWSSCRNGIVKRT